MKCFIGLGGNIGDPLHSLRFAVREIDSLIGPVLDVSPVFVTRALNPPELQDTSQPDFLNAALVCSTTLVPHDILERLLAIEICVGRDRKSELKWGPRIIDIDLLAVDERVIQSPTLTLPHPEIENRDFVLTPLARLNPCFTHPISGSSAKDLLNQLINKDAPTYVLNELRDSLRPEQAVL